MIWSLSCVITLSIIILSIIVVLYIMFMAECDKTAPGVIATIILVSLIALPTVCFFIPCAVGGYDDNLTIIDETKLYSIDSGNGVHGSFVLGSGGVDDVQYYIGYTNTKGNHYVQVKYNAANSEIILDDNETPRVETYKYIALRNSIFSDLKLEDTSATCVYNLIYIPTGGLTNTYSIN